MSAQDWSRVVRKTRRKGANDANAIPIDVIVRHYGGEVKEGKAASVRCCIHDDSRKSAVMNTYDNLYFCHTCGKGGNAVSVVMEIESLEFKDALKRASEIVIGSGGTVRGKSQRRNSVLPRRSWDI